jgi:predicted amidohydrolase
MLVKVLALQSRLGQPLRLEEKLHIFRQKPDFISLPEYCMVKETHLDFSRSALEIKENLEYLRNLSIEFSTCLIAGSVVEAESDSLFNCTYIFNRGDKVGRYRKLNPVAGETDGGILPGDRFFVTEVDGVRIAVLICADALNISFFELLGEEKVDIIFIPTTSPYRPVDTKSEKHKRDQEIYLAGARAAGAYVVKSCGIGNLFRKPLQGRSLIVSPWDVIRRVPIFAEQDPTILTSVLNIKELREFRDMKKAGSHTSN